MISLLLQPLGPFVFAIAVGLMAGVVGTTSRSVLAFAVTVVLGAVIVALLDIGANLRAEWHGLPADGERGAPLTDVAWELITANVVVIGVVGVVAYAALLLLARP